MNPFIRILAATALLDGAVAMAQQVDPPPPPTLTQQAQAAWQRVTDVNAWNGSGHWRLAVSPYALHFSKDEDHRPVWAVGIERQYVDEWLAGASYFSNSFGQPSAFVYVGRRFPDLFGEAALFGQVSGGLMYGYRGEYKDKVPLNVGGFSPGLLLTVGWQFSRNQSAALHLLGTAGLMFQLAHDFR